MSRALAKWVLIAVSIIALLVTGALALPVRLWRSGEVPLPELVYSAAPHDIAKPVRVWIDADTACGTGKHRDPDDCLAVLLLAGASDIDIVGISTVFGNAPVSETDGVMRALVQQLDADTRRTSQRRCRCSGVAVLLRLGAWTTVAVTMVRWRCDGPCKVARSTSWHSDR